MFLFEILIYQSHLTRLTPGCSVACIRWTNTLPASATVGMPSIPVIDSCCLHVRFKILPFASVSAHTPLRPLRFVAEIAPCQILLMICIVSCDPDELHRNLKRQHNRDVPQCNVHHRLINDSQIFHAVNHTFALA
eukprot:364404_1